MRIILATLLIPVAFASNGGRGDVVIEVAEPGLAAEAAPSSGLDEASWEDVFERLKGLAVRRQVAGVVTPWTDVEEALDSLDLVLSTAAAESKGVDVPALAAVLQDLAIGCDARTRDRLATRVAAIASTVESARDARPLLRALARIIEPSVLPADAARTAHDALTARASKVLDRVIDLLTDPLAVAPPPFILSTLRRIETLSAGSPMPSFTARDIAGNELRSSELFGKVTVLRFWDPASPASVAAHEADAEFVRSFWDVPFELVGVAKSIDRSEYLSFVAERAFAGLQLFDGPISTELADALAKDAGRVVSAESEGAPMGASAAWLRPVPGAVFVIDASGTLRGRDLSHDALESLVRQLVTEENARRREQSLAHVRSR